MTDFHTQAPATIIPPMQPYTHTLAEVLARIAIRRARRLAAQSQRERNTKHA